MDENNARELRRDALEKMREHPRGGKHWKYTNGVLKDLMESHLQGALLGKFEATSWVNELLFWYTEMRLHYWAPFSHFVLDPDIKKAKIPPPMSLESLRLPYYLRGILLCLNYLLPRCGTKEDAKLPRVPYTLCLQRFFPDSFYMVDPEDKYHYGYLDGVTNGAIKAVEVFFQEATGPQGVEPGYLNRITYFPVPIADYWLYLEFLKEISQAYELNIHEKQEKISKERDAVTRAHLPGGGVFDEGLDVEFKTIVENYKSKMQGIMKDDPMAKATEGQEGFVISKNAIKEMAPACAELDGILKSFVQKYEAAVEKKGIPVKGLELPLVEHYHLDFLQDTVFGEKVMGIIVKFLKKIAKQYANPTKYRMYEVKCALFEVLFKIYPFYKDGALSVKLEEFKQIMKANQIPSNVLQQLLCTLNQLPAMNALTLYDRPLYLCSDGQVRFSLPLLYDALVYQYTQLLQEEPHGQRRAFRAESYVGFLITQFIHDHFPAENVKVFKLLIPNKDFSRRGPAWEKLQQCLPEFRYDRYQIELSDDQLGTPFSFLEYDLLFLFKGNLVIVDVKDDLFWEAKDLPAPVILWGRLQQAKMTNQVTFLQNPFIRAALAKEGIQYSHTESLVVTQGHINCGDFRYIGDLFNALQKLHWGEEFGASINAPRFSPYPW